METFTVISAGPCLARSYQVNQDNNSPGPNFQVPQPIRVKNCY